MIRLRIGLAVVALASIFSIGVIGAQAGNGPPDKVTLCHLAGNKHVELRVAAPAVPAHMAHGDSYPDDYGDCI